METTLIFNNGIDLPDFASFPLLENEQGIDALRAYFAKYIGLADSFGVGLILDTVTWRANADWGERLGYSKDDLASVNRRAVEFVAEMSKARGHPPIVVSGCVGPRGDAYNPDTMMTAGEAEAYHRPQIETLADTAADLITAYTLTYASEAVGIVLAARSASMPVVISFTVETDGQLPDGQPLREAIEEVDAKTEGSAAYFMINCAHPTHFELVLNEPGEWRERIRGLRANASTKSHAELDESEELDAGDPLDLAGHYRTVRTHLENLSVVGGCCGTDHRHVAAIAAALTT
ncbi:MAG: homocysteine S-methyltransferase family protein [Actinomycetota bacterium]|nr:homocysteine S-methyltransferase family protein [Actinomycetota bacterium]